MLIRSSAGRRKGTRMPQGYDVCRVVVAKVEEVEAQSCVDTGLAGTDD